MGTFLGSVSTPGTTDSALPNRVCWVSVKITSPASPSRACLFTQSTPTPHLSIQTRRWWDFQEVLCVLLESAPGGCGCGHGGQCAGTKQKGRGSSSPVASSASTGIRPEGKQTGRQERKGHSLGLRWARLPDTYQKWRHQEESGSQGRAVNVGGPTLNPSPPLIS